MSSAHTFSYLIQRPKVGETAPLLETTDFRRNSHSEVPVLDEFWRGSVYIFNFDGEISHTAQIDGNSRFSQGAFPWLDAE